MDRTLGRNVCCVKSCYWVGPGHRFQSVGEKLYFNESFHQHTLCAEQNDDECGDNVANHQPYLLKNYAQIISLIIFLLSM